MKKVLLIILFLLVGGVSYAKALPRNGVHKEYFSSGKLMSKGPFKNGKRHGVTKYYRQDGNLDRTVVFRKGKKEEVFRESKKEEASGGIDGALICKIVVALVVFVAVDWFVFVKIVLNKLPV